jgi:protein SCO1/2
MERRALLIGGSLIVLVLLAALVAYITKPESYRGATIDPPMPAAPITLTDSNGQPFQLESQRGKVVLLFFGYTNCPDVCPLTLAKLKQALAELGEQAQEAQVILVTTDPVRDTPEQLQKYVTTFNPNFLGLTGTPTELEKVWSDYGVLVMDGGETHSSRVYVIDRQGAIRLTIPAELEYQDIAHDLKLIMAGD